MFSSLDFKSGCHQEGMATQEDKEKTAFTTCFGLHQFEVMPFDFNVSPTVLQQLMDMVLDDLRDFTCAYLYDIIIFSETFADHFRHLQQVFDKLKEAGLKLKFSKCDFLLSKLN